MTNLVEMVAQYIDSENGVESIMQGWANEYQPAFLLNALRRGYRNIDEQDKFFQALRKLMEDWGYD